MSRFGLGLLGGSQGNDAFTMALLHMEGANGGTSFVDSSAGAHTWTASSATTSTVQKQFGASSMLTSTGLVSTPDSADYTLGSGNFTVDCWFNVNGNSLIPTKFMAGQASAFSVASTSSWRILALPSGISAAVFQGGAAVALTGTTNFASTSTWNHLAFVRDGGTLYLFLNGVQEDSGAISGAVNDSAVALSVSHAPDANAGAWSGYVDEFRLSVGVARWNSNFSPPTVQYS